MTERDFHRYSSWFLIILLLAAAIWVSYESKQSTHAHFGMYRSTPSETIVIKPGRTIPAFYAFFVVLVLLPAAWLFRAAQSRKSNPIKWAGFLGILVAATIAGFGYEVVQTEIRLTLSSFSYRSAGQVVGMRWAEIDAMALREHSRKQWIELLGAKDAIRIDLGPFSGPDRRLLVTELPRIARLGTSPRKLPDGWVWRRMGRIQMPE